MVAWAALAAGGVYPWTTVPLIGAAATLLALAPPRLWRTPETRTLDASLLTALAAASLTCLPMPPFIVATLAPLRAPLVQALTVAARPTAAWQTLSLDPRTTGYALTLAATALVVFFVVRQLCAAEGPRRIGRAVALTSLLVAVVALVQPAVDPRRLYGLWSPVDEGARPYGPFVNRNHFASWALLAIPLSTGYAVSTLSRRPNAGTWSGMAAAGIRAATSKGAWAAAAACLLTLGLAMSGSRSGVLGAGAVGAIGAVLGWPRLTARGRRLAGVAGIACALFVTAYASAQPLLSRAEETLLVGAGDRPQIWRDAAAVADDFWLTGSGAGTFATTMLVYQTTDRQLFTNQAHNHYLQLAAEGGAIVVVPVAIAAFALFRLFWERARRDTSHQLWMRLGAAAGMGGVLVQSVFETGLRVPGNAVLFAVAAAVALHRPRVRTPRDVEPTSAI